MDDESMLAKRDQLPLSSCAQCRRYTNNRIDPAAKGTRQTGARVRFTPARLSVIEVPEQRRDHEYR